MKTQALKPHAHVAKTPSTRDPNAPSGAFTSVNNVKTPLTNREVDAWKLKLKPGETHEQARARTIQENNAEISQHLSKVKTNWGPADIAAAVPKSGHW